MTHKNKQGFTLIEVMFASVILMLIAGVLYGTLSAGSKAYASGTTLSDLQNQTRLVLDQMAEEIRQSGASVLTVIPFGVDSEYLQFQVNEGYDGTSITWSDTIWNYAWYAPGEYDNGLDDNSNGLIDEMSIHRATATAEESTLTDWLKEGTLNFSLSGSVLTISLTLERPDGNGGTVSASGEVAVELRNP